MIAALDDRPSTERDEGARCRACDRAPAGASGLCALDQAIREAAARRVQAALDTGREPDAHDRLLSEL